MSPDFPTDNPAVKPIPLQEGVVRDGVNCTVSGWGLLREEDETGSEILQVVTVPFITYDHCTEYYTDGEIKNGTNCASYPQSGKDALPVSIPSFFTS